jgi:uncharacterized membrane protein YcaP (DUF421 family)
MFDLSLPWWEFVARASMVYFALLVMMRVSGKRTVGQFTPFDLLVVMLLSESVSASLAGGDDSIPGGLLLAGTLIALNVIVATLTARVRGIASLIDGEPVLLGRDGKLFHAAIRRQHIPLGDVEQALRQNDTQLADMKLLMLETDGEITVVSKDKDG